MSHRFLKGVSGGGGIAIVGKSGMVEWAYTPPGHESNDVWLLPSGNIVVAYGLGAREITPAKTIAWDFPAPAGSEIQSCQPLPDGRFLIGETHSDGVSYLREIDRTKAVFKTVTVNTGIKDAHGQWRQVRKTAQGTYLLSSINGTVKSKEVDSNGAMLRDFLCAGFTAVPLPNGNTLLGCGGEGKVIEVDAQNRVVWQIGGNDVPGNKLALAAGVQRLQNGNTVVCNWFGHGGDATEPQVFEVTSDKKVVWEVRNQRLGMISNVEILDPEAAGSGEPADVINGQRWEVLCNNPIGGDENCDNHLMGGACPATGRYNLNRTVTFGGSPGTIYDVTVRIRGVVEPKPYAGGTSDGKHFYVGGTPVDAGNASVFNIYSLSVSSPKQIYYLNHDEGKGVGHYVFTVDHMKTIKIEGGATIKMVAFDLNCKSIGNCIKAGPGCTNMPFLIPDVPPYPKAFNGQFMQLDVISVTP